MDSFLFSGNYQKSVFFFLFFIIIIFISDRFLLSRRKRSNKRAPSPPSILILGHLRLIKKPVHLSLAVLSARYGPVLSLRFGSRPILVISSLSAAAECFSKHDIVFANRPRLLSGKYIAYNYTTMAWAPFGPHWRNLRRISALEILSSIRLNSSSEVRNDEVASMVRRLARDSVAAAGGKVSLKARIWELAYNVMMRMIAGRRCYGEEAADVEEARRFHQMVEETFDVSGASSLGDFVPVLRLVEKFTLERRIVRLQAKRDAFMQSLIDGHRKRGACERRDDGKQMTIIDVLLGLQQDDTDYYTDDIIKGHVGTLLSAGTDTSAITMEWAMSLLLSHPDVLEKARAELDLTVGPDRIVEESNLTNLPYLNCIIKETLRLYPPTPIIPAHESSSECTVGGFDVAGGTMLLVNVWAIQRDPTLWEDPTSFCPERFATKEAGDKLLPFGMGRRACPGEGLAMRIVGLALAALIQCFDWECGCDDVDFSERVGTTMIKAKPLEAVCRPRRFVPSVL